MSVLFDRYQSEPWFKPVRMYLLARRQSIQERLLDSFRYVELNTQNGPTFSYEFASVLRDAGSVFGSVLDALVKGTRGDPKLRTNFADYRTLLLHEDPEIYRRSVHVVSLYPQGMVVPLSSLADTKGLPRWWVAHASVKHLEYDYLHAGNLGSAVVALGALVLIEYLLGMKLGRGTRTGGDLWINVGNIYPDDAIEMHAGGRLFLDYE